MIMNYKKNHIYLHIFLCLLFIVIYPVISDCQENPQKTSPDDEYYSAFYNNWFETTPVRGEVTPLRFKRTGFEYNCNECHQDLKTHQKYFKPEGEHKNIVLDHGLNVNCLNCHHQKDRNFYAAYGDGKISQEDSYLLCMKCHGPIYRDWEAGIHGRVNGYWTAELGQQNKLDCTQCHDPHKPGFGSLAPMPPPAVSGLKTLKQGNPHE